MAVKDDPVVSVLRHEIADLKGKLAAAEQRCATEAAATRECLWRLGVERAEAVALRRYCAFLTGQRPVRAWLFRAARPAPFAIGCLVGAAVAILAMV